MTSDLLPTLLPEEPSWDAQDAAEFRQWVLKPLAQKLLRRLIFSRPMVSSYEQARRAIQQDERAGFEACIAEILNLAESPVSRAAS